MKVNIENAFKTMLHSPDYCGKGYIFDQSIAYFCPRLLNDIPNLGYTDLTYDLRDPMNQFGMYDAIGGGRWKQWPSLFVGNAGVRSQMHQDTDGTGFYLMVMSGRKLFRTIRAQDATFFATHNLMEDSRQDESGNTIYSQEMNQGIPPWNVWQRFVTRVKTEEGGKKKRRKKEEEVLEAFDLFEPSTSWRNLSSKLIVYETVLEAGDVIYLPSWALHGAINLVDETVSVSANYIHYTNVKAFTRWCNALQAEGNQVTSMCELSGLNVNSGHERSYAASIELGLRCACARLNSPLLFPPPISFIIEYVHMRVCVLNWKIHVFGSMRLFV